MNPRLAALAAIAGSGWLAASPGPAAAKPAQRAHRSVAKPAHSAAVPAPAATPASDKPRHDGAHARVAINRLGDLRPAREAVGRREEPLTAEEETAKQIEKLLRGPLRYGVTGLFVADARTGEALFAVNADDALNPASNVKMISTAAALELLGAEFRYPTRLIGAAPEAGIVYGDAYLIGSYDPTLSIGDLDELAAAVAARGITRIEGSLVLGSDPTRDGIYRAAIPIGVRAGEPGGLAVATLPAGMDLVAIAMAARTGKTASRPRLSYKLTTGNDGAGHPRLFVAVSGSIGKGGATTYWLSTRERTAIAAYALRAALRAHGVSVAGDFKIAETSALDDPSVTGSLLTGAPAATNPSIELARHESARLGDIIAHVNKWSINWLADRVIMTAAAIAKHQPPSMELAVSTMYDWLDRHPRIAKPDLVVDTGSGLSYRTRITTRELVSIVRSAAGFTPDGDTTSAQAWLDSLSIAGTDGTLSSRFRTAELRGRIRGKTGTLSTAIALSGVLELDPQRPLAFSLVTNGDGPLSPRYVRRAHEQVIDLLCHYLARTQGAAAPAPAPAPPPVLSPLHRLAPGELDRGELDELESDSALDDEAAGAR